MNLQFRPGIIEYKRKISVALLHNIMTIVHIGFGIFQRNIESFSHTVLLSYKFVCLFDLILYVPSTIFQLYRDGSSWVEPVLS